MKCETFLHKLGTESKSTYGGELYHAIHWLTLILRKENNNYIHNTNRCTRWSLCVNPKIKHVPCAFVLKMKPGNKKKTKNYIVPGLFLFIDIYFQVDIFFNFLPSLFVLNWFCMSVCLLANRTNTM